MFEILKTNRFPTSRNQRQAGFTLIELLLVIAIIAVLSSMALGVMSKAQDDAKASATQSRILMIENLLAIQLEDYEVRRLPISVRELGFYWTANQAHTPYLTKGTVTQPQYVAVQNIRRRIMQDIIGSEFPRPIYSNGVFSANSDVGVFPSRNATLTGSDSFSDWLDDWYPTPVNGLTLRQRLANLVPSRVQSYGPMKSGAVTDPDFNLPGEYLYAALERMDVDGTPATELLGKASIGNTDEDGYPEVIDAWGEPMQLRIWQVAATRQETDSAGNDLVDVWEDDSDLDGTPDNDRNFDIGDLSTGPFGYVVIDPTIPRVLQKVRFEVVSTRLGRHR